ncbi:uncharacterized protein LY89DRAFT_739278 [Mollisia scopiformis]|uniref:Uncharacterized protein n=1 Tax=Mollisia scopiformis TaxID=149040 RepID=A0A194WTQ1_MOLSC|nr:uncharacterized protein LY89DRAFT_739278 [Mollisia scopiformis]KUJ11064.1 hypothetical protein LY89DRAFT_739278 [Mollisia scopiformis]
MDVDEESSSPVLDKASILASYAPSEAPFSLPDTLPSSPTTISSPIPLPETTESIEYSYTEPLLPSTRTVKVYHKDIAPLLSSAGVRGLITTVVHGTYSSRPATLILFSFSFRSGDHGFRFKNANIKIQFSNRPSSKPEETSPAIATFAPRKIYGLPTKEGRKNTIGGEISLQVPAGPLTVGPTLNGSRESEWEQTHRYKTVGNFWSSKYGTDWDIVYWDMKENKRTKEGIPDRLNVGVVVEREEVGAFTASVDIEVDTPVLSGAFSSPWEKRRPAAFVPGVEMGKWKRTRRFEELSERDWRELVPFEEEWESVFVGERMNRSLEVPGAWPGGPHAAQNDGNDGDVDFVRVKVDIGEQGEH